MAGPGGRDAGRLVPTGLIGMALLLAMLEGLVIGRDRFATDQAENWRHKARAAGREATSASVLLFGDSMVEFGVIPRAIERRTGRPAYNLAVHGGSPAAAYVLLRRALEAGARPAAVVVDFMPHQLITSPVHPTFRRAWSGLAGPRDALDLTLSARDPAFLGALLLSRALASYEARHDVRAGLLAALRGEAAATEGANPLLRRNWDRNRGAQVMPARPRPPGPGADGGDGLYNTKLPDDPVSIGYVRRFLALAGSRGIPVYWLLPPLSPEAQALREARGLDARYTRFVRAVRDEAPGVVVVDARRAGYGAGLFVDAVHLNRRGALALSDDLAALLARPPAAPRWVDLPRYRDRPIAVAVEDLDQSRAALGSDGGTRRR